MRISDWSSDVCSSDLSLRPSRDRQGEIDKVVRLRALLYSTITNRNNNKKEFCVCTWRRRTQRRKRRRRRRRRPHVLADLAGDLAHESARYRKSVAAGTRGSARGVLGVNEIKTK